MESPFVSDRTKVLTDIPGAPGHTATVCGLASKQREKAAFASQLKALDKFKEMGGAAMLKEIQALGGEEQARAASKAQIAVDPFHGYDRTTIVVGGVVEWSFGKPVSPEVVDALDDETAAYLATEILGLTRLARDAAGQPITP